MRPSAAFDHGELQQTPGDLGVSVVGGVLGARSSPSSHEATETTGLIRRSVSQIDLVEALQDIAWRLGDHSIDARLSRSQEEP